MGVTWTPEQQKVIDLRNRNILVSAAAGSGKTAVLVERIITMLTKDEPPIDVDQLLVVTFTEAAAAEMKERIRVAIEQKLEEEPDNEHLKRQATLIHNARITTIHSFCLSVIKDHFYAIHLDPGFRIGEEGELKLLCHDVLGEVLEEEYTEGRQRFLDFTTAYGDGKNDKKIEELILKIYEYSRSYPDAKKWIHDCAESYRVKDFDALEETEFIRVIKDQVSRYLKDAANKIRQAMKICTGEADGPYMYETALVNDSQLIQSLRSKDTFLEMSTVLDKDYKWTRLPGNRDENVSENKANQVKYLRDTAKKIIKEMKEQFFYAPSFKLLEDLNASAPMMEELADLVCKFADRFEEKKRSKNMIDFSDMEQYALQILTEEKDGRLVPSPIAKEYQRQFVEIMIDEYQDSNLIQEALLTSVSTIWEDKYNIFMVGDVKQSIYRFRLSRPEIFMDKYNTYDKSESKKQRIDLHKNFRSRKEVLDSVNFIFRQIMTEDLGGIDYDDDAALNVGADYKKTGENATEVLVVDTDIRDNDHKKVKGINEREIEARAIAGKIRSMMEDNFRVTDKESGKLRPLQYRDIVILTRSSRGFSDVFVEILGQEGIPAFAGTKEGYFATQEIGVLLDYLRVLDNARQDLPLTAVLTSPIGGCSAKELALIRSSCPEEPFYETVRRYRAEGTEEELRDKLENCLSVMEKIREIVPYTPMHELLQRVLDDTGYAMYMSAMPGGIQRKANIDMLMERAKAFESTSYKGLFHFVRYMEQLQKYEVDYGEANVEEEQADTVRLMTIHKSKGLEFPVVFVAGMGKRFNMQDINSRVVLNSKFGVGLEVVDLKQRTKRASLLKKTIRQEEKLDSLGEELRVLYVAYTRAKEKLIITGTMSNLEKKQAEYESVQEESDMKFDFLRLSKATTYWDFVLPAVLRAPRSVPLRLKVLNMYDIIAGQAETQVKSQIERSVLEDWDTERVYDEEMHENLRNQFAYRYPYENSQTRKLKFSVSELKKRIYLQESGEMEDSEQLYEETELQPILPKFMEEEVPLTGASRGTAYHRALELLNFAEDYDTEKLKNCLRKFTEDGKMTDEMRKAVCIRDFLKFLQTDSGKRMQACAKQNRLFKEQPFVLGVPATDLWKEEEEGELVLVQGIIDVYFEEEDGLVVLDYKTDRVRESRELVERYHGQLDYYARALEQATGKTVKEKIIYSFTLGEEIHLP